MTKDERRIMGNELYGVIFPLLAKYEARGGNAHPRTQLIMEDAINKCSDWCERQRPPVEHDPEITGAGAI